MGLRGDSGRRRRSTGCVDHWSGGGIISAIGLLRHAAERARIVAPRAPEHPVGTAALTEMWEYRPRNATGIELLRRLHRARPVPPPEFSVARDFTGAARWTVYFVYAPNGLLDAAQRYTLSALRAEVEHLGVIVAAPSPSALEDDALSLADALIWKSLDGFDFSAYAIAIDRIARLSEGADVLLLNDSVLGPFSELSFMWERAQWDITSVTAFAYLENHAQSYAMVIKDVRPALLNALEPVLSTRWAFDRYEDVVLHQESRLARVASQAGLSVGALWYADGVRAGDASLWAADALVEAGNPFMKRALFGKHRGVFADERLESVLSTHHHPAPSTWMGDR